MRTIATYLPAIACGAMLLFMCIPMMRAMHRKPDGESTDVATRAEVVKLREEIDRLKAQRGLAEEAETVDG